MDKIIITGANGFLGSHLIDFYIKKDYEIYGLERPNQNYKNLVQYTDGKETFSNNEKLRIFGESIEIPTNNTKLRIIECNIKNAPLLETIIKKIKPKFLFHFAAQPYVIPSFEDPINTFNTNVIGTINIFEPIKKYHIPSRIILACSATEYGITTKIGRPLKESDPLQAVHPYGISKIAAELLSQQYFFNFDIEIINLRFFNITGIRRVNDAPSDFIRKIAQIDLELISPIIEVGNLSPYRDFLDVLDVIQAIHLATIKGKPGETYNVCSGNKIQIRQILNIALNFSKKEIEVKENTPRKLRASDEDIILGDNSKIKKELGWQSKIPIEETLKDMYKYWIEYYKKENINLHTH
ncbi:MAG: GDP-mannose 4,6-dehydratase [Promethearchaeota archaeon]